MAYNTKLAARLRRELATTRSVVEKEMFGGIAFMVHGNMCCGVIGDNLMLRVGKDAHDGEVARPHAREMDFAKRPMRGFIYVAPKGVSTTAALRSRLKPAIAFMGTLPKK